MFHTASLNQLVERKRTICTEWFTGTAGIDLRYTKRRLGNATILQYPILNLSCQGLLLEI